MRCHDCRFFQIDYVGSKGAKHGSCVLRDRAYRGGGWRNGSSKPCKKFAYHLDLPQGKAVNYNYVKETQKDSNQTRHNEG